jgi:hypothetical protein
MGKKKKVEEVELSRSEQLGADITSPSPKVPQVKAGMSPARKKLNEIIERKRAARGNN